VSVLLWSLPLEELEAKLNADELMQSDLRILAMIYTNNASTSGAYYDLTSFGMPLTPEELDPYMDPVEYPPEQFTFTVIASSGTVAGQGTRMIKAFQLDPASSSQHVELLPDSTSLSYAADLHTLTRTPMPVANAAITFDWSELETSANGKPFYSNNVTEALVARYSQTPAELEAQFLDLELIHEGMWRGAITEGESISLANLRDDSGAPFAGFDASSTWVVALFCGTCANPAPWYMTVVEPCGAQ
jgi:hypothetical protein